MINSIELQVLGAWGGASNWTIICVLLNLSVQIGLLNNVGDLIISGFGERQSSEVFSGNIFILHSPLNINGIGNAPDMSV